MDPLHVTIAMVPISMYLLLIGWINIRPRPLVTTGIRDLGALAMGIAGFVITGPLELFLPEVVASLVGGWVWLPMISLYVLVVSLVLLMMRPRLIIYNMSVQELRPMLQQVMADLDPQASWVGDCMVAPTLGVQFGIESYAGVRNVTLASVGHHQDIDGWKEIELQLRSALSRMSVPSNMQGLSYLLLAVFLCGGVAYTLYNGHQEIAQAFRDMMRM